MQVNMHEAKSQLSRLVAAALAGETVVLARAGEPVVRLVAANAPATPPEPPRWDRPAWLPPKPKVTGLPPRPLRRWHEIGYDL